MIVTPLGTGIIVQEFTQLNPVHLVDSILNELTKEERDYGNQYHEKAVTKQAGGVTLQRQGGGDQLSRRRVGQEHPCLWWQG